MNKRLIWCLVSALGLSFLASMIILAKNDNGCRHQPPEEEHGKAADITRK